MNSNNCKNSKIQFRFHSSPNSTSQEKLTTIIPTISIYSNFLKFISFIGIFPHKFTNSIIDNKNIITLVPFFSYKVWLVLLFEIVHYGFLMNRLYSTGIADKSSIILLSVFCLRDVLCVIIICTFLAKKEVFNELLNNWNQIESEILEEYEMKSGSMVKLAIAYQRKWYRIIITFNIVSLVAVETFICLDHLVPHHSVSSSLLSNSDSERSLFLSIIAQCLALAMNRIILAQFETVLFSIASSIRFCIRIISPLLEESDAEDYDQEQEPAMMGQIKVRPMIATIETCRRALLNPGHFTIPWHNYYIYLETAAEALKHYKALSQLVTEFNSIFKWLLFSFKSYIVLHLCGVTYMSCRFIRMAATTSSSSVPNPTLNEYGPNQLNYTLAVMIFLNTMEHLIKMHLILYPLGAVVSETKSFVSKWTQALWTSQKQVNKQMLQSVAVSSFSKEYKNIREEINDVCRIPIGFQVGCFYSIKPSTVLTFFSIVTTYLIVFLQI